MIAIVVVSALVTPAADVLAMFLIALITIISGFVIGPRRLPIYAGQLARCVRELRGFIDSTRARAETELGVPAVDLRQYDPRRIVRDALDAPAEPAAERRWTVAGGTSGHPRRVLATEPAAEDEATSTAEPRTIV